MKVTVNLDAKLVKEAMKWSEAKTITEALKTALTEYVAIKRLKQLSAEIKEKPLRFMHTADETRSLNRS